MNQDKLNESRKKWEQGQSDSKEIHSAVSQWGLASLIEYNYETAASDYRVFRYFEGAGEIHCSIDASTEDEREAWKAFVKAIV